MADQGFQLTPMQPATTAAMREDIQAYKVEFGTGDTDLDFVGWLKSARPQRYQLYNKMTGPQNASE